MNPVYAVKIDESTFAPAKFGSIAKIVDLIIPIIISAGSVMFLIMLLRGAFTILTGEGKPEAIAKGQKMLMFAVVGLVVMISAFTIVKVVGLIFNVNNTLPF